MKNNLIITLKRFLWLLKNLFHKYSKEEKETIKANKRLIKEFPFLLPRNRFNDKVSYDYDYTYTELDDMPEGWRISFGIEMCEKIKKCLIKADYLNSYRITQIKEKYGTLRWYDNGVPESISSEHYSIINHYEDKSLLVCQLCGKPTKYVTSGWIAYLCEEHFKEHLLQNSELDYYELTWSDIPIRYVHYSDKVTKIESDLKGEMMCTWKRYSKHNNIINDKNKKSTDEIETPTDPLSKTGLW